MAASLNLPGRLGDDARVLKTDPRSDPRMVTALAVFGLDGAPEAVPFTADSSLGGGMTVLKRSGASYVRWRGEMAAAGLVVLGVEFRNAGGSLGNHPFPAGLNDCMSALQ
ncbi:MAG: hypothetical protein ACR2RL_23775 [Gammaproteobacteria bacterium]